MKYVDYIAAAIRFAELEVGEKVDLSKYILITTNYEVESKDEIIGFPVYVVPVLTHQYLLACPWGHSKNDLKMIKAFVEFQEIYPYIDWSVK